MAHSLPIKSTQPKQNSDDLKVVLTGCFCVFYFGREILYVFPKLAYSGPAKRATGLRALA